MSGLDVPIDSVSNPKTLTCFTCKARGVRACVFRGRKALDKHLQGHGTIQVKR